MAIEIEKKYRLTEVQRQRVLRNLESSGAIYQGEDFEENNIYRNATMEASNSVLRLRKTSDKTVLTFKRRLDGALAIKRQIEHETEVGDAGEMQKIIECLGFEKTLVYEKRRRTWTFRQVEIVVDELPFGFYMEIEGNAAEIEEAETILDLKQLAAEHETYPHLTKKFGRQNGSSVEARFG